MKRYIRSNVIDNVYSYDKLVLSGNHLTPEKLSKALNSELYIMQNMMRLLFGTSIQTAVPVIRITTSIMIWRKYEDMCERC